MTTAARAARLSRPWSSTPTLAVVGDLDAAPLRAAGWEVPGRLAATPYADPRDALGYVDVGELLADPRVDAVAVDGEDRELAALLPSLRRAGLLVLLPTPAPLDPELVRAARAVDGPDACVGLLRRWEPWALTVSAALPVAGGPPVQVTVRGWPRGAGAAAELVDLVGLWCGSVAAVVAAPAELPAAVLPVPGRPQGAPVTWSLLTESGATVLVSHDGGGPPSGAGGGPLVRLSFATARLEAGPTDVRWEGGDRLPLALLPSWVPWPQGGPPGLVATAAVLADATGGRGLPPGVMQRPGPKPAVLGDLLVVARVLEALRASARSGQPERVA